MGTTIYPAVPVAQPAAEPWPIDDHTIQSDEMFARQLDIEFSAGVRELLHDPETGVAAQNGEAALEAISGAMPALDDLKQQTLAQALGPGQRAVLEPMIDTRLDWAAGTLGRLAQRATVQVDDQSVAERVAGLKQDAALSWQDPASLRTLGRTAVEELRYQGERRGWDQAETDTRVRAGLSDLYAGAVEAAIGQEDLQRASELYAHAREVIAPDRQAAIDHRFTQAREAAVYRDVDRDMRGLPLDPAGPPAMEVFEERADALTPEDASDDMRARIAGIAAFAQRRAERQWQKQQAGAGLAALDWAGRNPEASPVTLPSGIGDWLAPDQWRGLEFLGTEGRLKTDSDLFERLDREMVYAPEAFAALDLDRHRLSLDDADHARFADVQKTIADGTTNPASVRYGWLRRAIDQALEARGIDIGGPEAAKVRAEARDQLNDFATGRIGPDISSYAAVESDAHPETPPGLAPAREDDADEGPSSERTGDPNIVFTAGGGRPPARRGGGAPLTPFEQMRTANFHSTLETLRQLEPNNRELSYIAPHGWVPRERDVARVREELAQAQQRAEIPGGRPAHRSETRPGNQAFHYTRENILSSVERSGLYSGSYATTTATLSPLQAQIDLALPPNRGLPGAILRIDLEAMRAAGYEIPKPTRVGRSYNMPGGGYEMKFPYPIKPEFITVIK